MSTTPTLTPSDAELIVASHYSYFPPGHAPEIDALRAHAQGKLLSIDAEEQAALQQEIGRLRALATDADAAFLACCDGSVKLRPEDALAVAGLTSIELESLRRDAALGIAVMQFLHNARSACREVSLEGLMKQVMEVAERARGATS